MEITQKGAQSLRMKIRNSELYLKEATVICFHPLAARLPKLASKLERLDYFHLSTPSTGEVFNWLLVGWSLLSKRALLHCMQVLFEHFFFTKKVSHYKQRQLNWCFLSLFYFFSIISASVIYCLSSKHSPGWQFAYVATFFAGIQQNLLFLYTVYTTVVNNVLREPQLPLRNSSFELLLSESQAMFNLGQVCQNSEAKIWKPA